MKRLTFARVNNEEPDGVLDPFNAGPITLYLSLPDREARHFASPRYEGRASLHGVMVSVTVSTTRVAVHFYAQGARSAYTSTDTEITPWGFEDGHSDVLTPSEVLRDQALRLSSSFQTRS